MRLERTSFRGNITNQVFQQWGNSSHFSIYEAAASGCWWRQASCRQPLSLNYSCRGFGHPNSFVAVQFQDVFASCPYRILKGKQDISPQVVCDGVTGQIFTSVQRRLSRKNSLTPYPSLTSVLPDRHRYLKRQRETT